MPTLDLTPLRPADGKPDVAKLVLLAAAALYLAPTVLDPLHGNLLFGIVFYTHEAGHVVFSPFGTFLAIAGGTIMQLLVPVAFAASFVRQGQPYSAAIVLFWLAMSLMNASVYAGDAIALEMPLSGSWESGQEELAEHGETRHDWHNMLDTFGMLKATPVVSGAFRLAATLTFGAALYLSLLTAGAPVPATWKWAGAKPRRPGKPPVGKAPRKPKA